MNPYIMPAYCDVCGEEGMGTIRTAAAMWDANSSVRHTDPSVCADNLARKKKQLEKREKELAEKEASLA